MSPNCFVNPFNYSLINNSVSPALLQLKDYLSGTATSAGTLSIKVRHSCILILSNMPDEDLCIYVNSNFQ